MTSAAPATAHALQLGHGIALRCTMDSLDDSVLVGLVHKERVLFERRFNAGDRHDALRLSLPFLRVDLALWVDVFAGEVVGEGHIAVKTPGDPWRELLDVDREVLVRFDPAVGVIGDSATVHEPVVDHPEYGRSQLCTPAILRIHVDDGDRAVVDAGRLVKTTLFPGYEPFVFNTVACVGPADETGLGAYTNPNSIWFNVFFGYYQIDAPKPQWSRPFGYQSADGPASAIAFEDVARLGKSDWNFFSNWVYGVPLDAITPFNAVDLSRISARQSRFPRQVGRSRWHSASVDGVDCVSTYESDRRGTGRLVTNSAIDDVWRRAFGLPNPQSDWPDSFVPTTLRAELHMAYREDEAAYRTLIFGATAVAPVDHDFLGAQMTAVQRVIERGYPESGFPLG